MQGKREGGAVDPVMTKRMASTVTIASLPTACILSILRYLVDGETVSSALYPDPFPLAQWHQSLAPLALVNHDWLICTRLLTAQTTHIVSRIDMTAAVAQLPSLGTDFGDINRHRTATDFRLVMNNVVTVSEINAPPYPWLCIPSDYDDAIRLRSSRCVVRSMNSITIDWPWLLTPRAATLIRLDLSQTPLDCVHLGRILHTASTLCPHVRVLALPTQTRARCNEDTEAREDNLNELYGALQRWHRTNGGLVHLRIPFGRFDENTAVRLLRAFAAYCPDIEYLDGWQETYVLDDDGMASCEAYWPAPSQWWDAFWTKCTKLRAFHTVMMPFDDDYFENLQLPSVESFVFAIDSAKARHYEVSRMAILSMAMSMPNLQRLRLEIPFVRDDVWSPRECIDDVFVRAVVLRCPLLQEFRLQCADKRVLFNIGTTSCRYLAQLQNLRIVELQRVQEFNIEMVTHLFQFGVNRHVAISFGIGQDEVWNLLRLFADSQFDKDDPTIFSLLLWNTGHLDGDGITEDEVKALLVRLTQDNDLNVEVHVHTKHQTRSERVEFRHLEYRLNGSLCQTAYIDKAKSKTHGYNFPVCESTCLHQGISES